MNLVKCVGMMLVSTVLSAQALADVSLELSKVVTKYATLYKTSGQDNNTMDYVISNKGFEDVAKYAVSLGDATHIKEVMERCVFMRTGAYGEHIDSKKQEQLVEGFYADLTNTAKAFNKDVRFYRANQVIDEGATLGEPYCSLIIQVRNHATIKMNSTMMD